MGAMLGLVLGGLLLSLPLIGIVAEQIRQDPVVGDPRAGGGALRGQIGRKEIPVRGGPATDPRHISFPGLLSAPGRPTYSSLGPIIRGARPQSLVNALRSTGTRIPGVPGSRQVRPEFEPLQHFKNLSQAMPGPRDLSSKAGFDAARTVRRSARGTRQKPA